MYNTILRPFYDKHITLKTLSHHPTKVLFELLQSRGCQDFEITKEIDEEDESVIRCDGESLDCRISPVTEQVVIQSLYMTLFSQSDTTIVLLHSQLEERRSSHWTHWKVIRSSCSAIVIAVKKLNNARRPSGQRRQKPKSRHQSRKRAKMMTRFDGFRYSRGILVDLVCFLWPWWRCSTYPCS